MSWRRSEDQTNHEILQETYKESPGWARIIKNVDLMIQYLDPDYKVQQIKEKFGGLRYYISTTDNYNNYIEPKFPSFCDPISVFISWAENLSWTICEDCGTSDPNDVVQTDTVGEDGFWVRTLCMDCRKKLIIEKG